MSISIGTSAPSSAWETHAAWLRLRGDCQQFLDRWMDGGGGQEADGDRTAAGRDGDVTARPEPGSGVNTLV